MSAPRLAYHCGTCDHELTLVCETCQQRDHDERCEAHARDQQDARQAQDAWRSQTPAIDDLEQSLGVDVVLDVEGPDGDGDVFHVVSVDLFGEPVRGYSVDGFADAVADLRRVLAKALRDWAFSVETGLP